MDSLQVTIEGRVAIFTLNRPEALNALNQQLMLQLVEQAEQLDGDQDIGCMIFTGVGRAFAAGADIRELAEQRHLDMFSRGFFEPWDRFAKLNTPKIAAVSGYALGGGCELAMMCDILLAADSARFGQPEIKIGVTPGMGGSQRLTKLIGRARAMDMILTGRMIDADEALRSGLVSRVISDQQLLVEAKLIAETIASYSKPVCQLAREMVAQAEQLGLDEGLRFERRNYYSLYGSEPQREGMAAFMEKRQARFHPSKDEG